MKRKTQFLGALLVLVIVSISITLVHLSQTETTGTDPDRHPSIDANVVVDGSRKGNGELRDKQMKTRDARAAEYVRDDHKSINEEFRVDITDEDVARADANKKLLLEEAKKLDLTIDDGVGEGADDSTIDRLLEQEIDFEAAMPSDEEVSEKIKEEFGDNVMDDGFMGDDPEMAAMLQENTRNRLEALKRIELIQEYVDGLGENA